MDLDIDTFRGIERLLIVIIGGVSIVAGWNLFREGVLGESSGTFQGKGWKFTLQKAGPGIFFAFFGSAICINSTVNGLSIKPKENSTAHTNKEYNTYYLGGQSSISDLDFSNAVNTLDLIKYEDNLYSEKQKTSLHEAVAILEKKRNFVLKVKFKENYGLYEKYSLLPKEILSPDRKKILENMEPYYETLLDNK